MKIRSTPVPLADYFSSHFRTILNIKNIPGTARISLAIDAREGYEGSILFHNCKTGISESSPITGARRYNSASFIAAEPTLLGPTLCRCCRKMPFRVWGVIETRG